MNVELTKIAEQKLEQMGATVHGVLVTNEAGAWAAVSEAGRVMWLDGFEGQASSAEPCRFHDDDKEACETYSGEVPCEPEQPSAGVVPEGWLIRRVDDRITVQHPDIGGYCASKDSDDTSAIAPVILYHLADAMLTAAPTAPAVEPRPLTMNRYGVDRDYFTKKLEILIRDMDNYTPAELARSLGRLAMTADSETMQESEFNAAQAVQGGGEPDWTESATLDSEAWKNPLLSKNDRLQIADGAVAWRDEVICNLRATATHPHNGEQGGEWVRCDERLPTEADADCNGHVWTHDKAFSRPEYAQCLFVWSAVQDVADITHWKPTGLTRPQPPKSKEGE